MVNLTQTFVAKLPAEDRDYYDRGVRGLVLRTRASGQHSYLVRIGRKWLTLGKAELLTPVRARELAQKALGQVIEGKDPLADKKKKHAATLEDFIEHDYKPWALANLKRPDEALARIAAVFPAELRRKRLTEINAFAVERWRSARHAAGVKPSTTNRDINVLRGILSKAVQWGALADHPLKQVKAAKIDTIGRVRYLSAHEEARLRAALTARDDRRRAKRESGNLFRRERQYRERPALGAYTDHVTPIVLLALNTGLRRGELFNLAWADVDLMRALLTVKGSGAKSGRTRYVPLNSEALAVLKTWQAHGDGSGLVFPGEHDEAMGTVKTAWARLTKDAKIAGFRFHDLRHTFASKLVQAGVDLNTVRELLGHANITMTLRYSHLRPDLKATAVEKIVASA